MRGTKHSMGGHTIAENGFVIDMAKLHHMKFNKENDTVTVGPGALWSELVFYLNRFGMSPQTLQSYSTFSVGGSLSVNAHGITSDESLQDSVISLTVIKWDGTEVVCSRDANGEGGELFGLVLGGYGMFGVVVEVELKVQPNVHLWMEMIECTVEEFPLLYQNIVKEEDVDIKLGRIDTISGEDCQLFIFRKQMEPGMKTVSNLPLEPRQMTKSSRLMYKWVFPSMKGLRPIIEGALDRALDWSDENERNQLIYESCEPLAHLYSPFHEVDDSFVLQEFFVPANKFSSWVQQSKSALTKQYANVTLLNLTVRYVLEDKTSFLSYSRAKGGSFAFVLYYRIRRSPEADATLKEIHTVLTDISLSLDGTFYLPYRHHYSLEQLETSYPMIKRFFEKKIQFDPHGMFSSSWSQNYLSQVLPDFETNMTSVQDDFISSPESKHDENFTIQYVNQHRTDSYHKLMSNPFSRNEFIEHFFSNIFNIESKNKLKGLMAKAIADPRNTNDNEVFQYIKQHLDDSDGPFNQISKMWKGILQTRRQRKEFVKETVTILHRLKRLNKIDGYVSIGDTGKLVRELTENKFVTGKVWVVHDGLGGIPQMIERGSENEVGEFVFIDYKDPVTVKVPSGSADLVTLNQGLHHFPQESIMPFLYEVRRILRKGGLFIIREHNAVPELIPSLDIAHSIFNVVTGVSVISNREEIRAFRPLLEWRKIIESTGLTDTYLYAMEEGDPTEDEMMCFYKYSLLQIEHDDTDIYPTSLQNITGPKTVKPELNGLFPEKVEKTIESLANQGPNLMLQITRNVVDQTVTWLIKISENLKNFNLGLTEGQQFLVNKLLSQVLDPVIAMLASLQPYLDKAKRKDTDIDLIPDELIVFIKGIQKNALEGKASPTELLIVGALKDFQSLFNSNTTVENFNQDNEIILEVNQKEVEKLFEKLLDAMPELSDISRLEKDGGFDYSLLMMIKSNIGEESISAGKLSEALYPYIDSYSWSKMAPVIEEIIRNPETNPFTLNNMKKRDGSWWKVTMGLLSSHNVKFTNYGAMLASMIGLSPIIEMWQVAQEIRNEENSKQSAFINAELTTNSINMLDTAVKLLRNDDVKDEASIGTIVKCLKLIGILESVFKSYLIKNQRE